MCPIWLLIRYRQPGVYQKILRLYLPMIQFAAVPDEELTPEQRYLDKLMRQKPKPGKGE